MNETRDFWKKSLLKIVDPIFDNLSKGTLKKDLPYRVCGDDDRSSYGCLEAFGRSFCGFAPFISSYDGRSDDEKLEIASYREKLLKCFDNATRPEAPDYMNFGTSLGHDGQPLVDVAFLSHGLYRSGDFVNEFPEGLKKQVLDALMISRRIVPWNNNWILFSAMAEVGIDLMGGKADLTRVVLAVRQVRAWYKGDGFYGDGPDFHMDYYNSFVIHPMMIDLCRYFKGRSPELNRVLPEIEDRASRYAVIQERMINHDGTYFYVGRSITYRFGAFQLLAQAMLQDFSPLSKAAVRCALTAVIKRVMAGDIFDDSGYLLHGIYSYQPSLAEYYLCTGSLYMCSAVFLPLGLPEDHPFWSDPDEKWTSLKIVSGDDAPKDHF